MARSDFALIRFFEQFDTGNPQVTRSFFVDGQPTGPGYLLIQHFDVEIGNHEILINSQHLPGFDIPAQDAINELWRTWMDGIPPGFLQQGDNRLTIRRVTSAGTEAFFVANVAIHWREVD